MFVELKGLRSLRFATVERFKCFVTVLFTVVL
jgi:hypothetical protein